MKKENTIFLLKGACSNMNQNDYSSSRRKTLKTLGGALIGSGTIISTIDSSSAGGNSAYVFRSAYKDIANLTNTSIEVQVDWTGTNDVITSLSWSKDGGAGGIGYSFDGFETVEESGGVRNESWHVYVEANFTSPGPTDGANWIDLTVFPDGEYNFNCKFTKKVI